MRKDLMAKAEADAKREAQEAAKLQGKAEGLPKARPRYSDRDPAHPFRVIADRGDLLHLGSTVVKRLRRWNGISSSFVHLGDALVFSLPEGAGDVWRDHCQIVARALRVSVQFSGNAVTVAKPEKPDP